MKLQENPFFHRLLGRIDAVLAGLRGAIARFSGRQRVHHARPHALPAPVSVVIPALNEERRIADVVRYALSDTACAEVIVIDDCSIDATRERAEAAGARVLTSAMLGKGESMLEGLDAAAHDIVVYLDGDLAGMQPDIISKLAAPIRAGSAELVKAAFGRAAGRVTELAAKPMLRVFFPELAQLAQPLGGIVAARKALLRQLKFEAGYGVDVGILIDAHRSGARIEQVDIGTIEHESQSLAALADMAVEVNRVILDRAAAAGRVTIDHLQAMFEVQRQERASFERTAQRLRPGSHIVLIDLDTVVFGGNLHIKIAEGLGLPAPLVDATEPSLGNAARVNASLLRFVPRDKLRAVANSLTFDPEAVTAVNALKRQGYTVGLVSGYFQPLAETLRKRIFADFVIASDLSFTHDVADGALLQCGAFGRIAGGCQRHSDCTANVAAHLRLVSDERLPMRLIAVCGRQGQLACLQPGVPDAVVLIDRSQPASRCSDVSLRVNSLADLPAVLAAIGRRSLAAPPESTAAAR